MKIHYSSSFFILSVCFYGIRASQMADATPTPNPTPTQIVHQSTTVITITQPISTKLTQTNFLTWKAQILPIINGHNLTRFITSDPPDVSEDDPVFLTWRNQDQLLL